MVAKKRGGRKKNLLGFKLSQVLLGLLHAILIVPPGSTAPAKKPSAGAESVDEGDCDVLLRLRTNAGWY